MRTFYSYLNAKVILLPILLGLVFQLNAQRTCGTMENLQMLMEKDPSIEQRMHDIEMSTQDYIKNTSAIPINGVITIPVVFHVVYNSPAENISEAQIQSQIQILNEDFRRMNADAANTPGDFTGVADDVEIEFCLATVDPNGAMTNGITRTSTDETEFFSDGNDYVKFNSSGGKDAWPTSDYLNIWTCDLGGGTLGYAQFPGGAAATDGVVIGYLYVGNTGTVSPPYDLGRTATHEVGHWLNLRHIWGDDDCTVDDMVADTPTAGAPNYTGTPCTYPGPNSCNDGTGDLPDMFQNYMDYSDDACMNLFTMGQTDRMRALFDVDGLNENDGFRASLLESNGCNLPDDQAVPTLGQWGIMVLGIIMLIMGLVFVRQKKIQIG